MTFHVDESTFLAQEFHMYDRKSLKSQKHATTLNLIRLIGVAVGAIFGVFEPAVNIPYIFTVISVAGFASALFADITLLSREPEKKWYQAREAAESIKSLSWCYGVCGAPFPRAMRDAESEFIKRYTMVRSKMADDVLVGTRLEKPIIKELISDQMNALRNLSLDERRSTYVNERTRNQIEWYSRKAAHNGCRSIFWKYFLIIAEIVAIGLITGKILGATAIDIAGIMAALIAAGAAWTHFKQHTALASAYGTARDDLLEQVGKLPQIESETTWAKEVAGAEEAISREHRLWQATLPSVTSP